MGIVKEAEFETCDHCGSRKRLSDEVRGCDECGRVFPEDGAALNFTVFRNGEQRADQVDCCSWKCVFAALQKVRSDYFVSLPYFHYDAETPEGARAEDFFAFIRGHIPDPPEVKQ
jgi:hypothetical protein